MWPTRVVQRAVQQAFGTRQNARTDPVPLVT